MTLNEYQKKAFSTCLHTSDNFSYMMLNLVGEVGEFASKVAKHIRKEHFVIDGNALFDNRSLISEEEAIASDIELQKEAGDILWQLSGLCEVMGWQLEDIAQQNLDKLSARKAAGTIDGNGDGISGNERTK